MPKGIFIRTKENIENIRKAQIKKWQNPEYRKYMSEMHKGNPSPMKGKHLSKEHKRKLSIAHKGKQMGNKNSFWKGGKNISTQGYMRIYQPNHPFNLENYILEHRLVIEKHLKRYLKPEERVHHINGIKTDNRIENLRLFKNDSEHTKFHFRNKPKLTSAKPNCLP